MIPTKRLSTNETVTGNHRKTICVNPFLLVIIKSFAFRNPLDSDTEFVRVEDPLTAVGRTFISALLASGFREIYDDNRYNAEFLPCPLGTFYNSSSRGEQGCIQCPPGKLESPSSYWEMKSESFRKPRRRRQQLNVIKKMFNEHENGPVHAFWIFLHFSAVLKKTKTMWNGQVVRICLAHGSCACSTRASQDLLVLPKQHDNRLFNDFFLKTTNIKAMLKLFWPLLIFNLRIQGLIWRGITYFVQNYTAIILRPTTSKLPCGTPATHFGAKLEAWTQLFRIFHYFSYFSWFWELWILFSEYLPDFNAIPMNVNWRHEN